MKIILKDGFIVNIDSIKRGNIIIVDESIESVNFDTHFDTLKGDYDYIIDCSDKYILPGIIDPHVHLRDMEQSYKETIETGTFSAINGGVTTVFAMPNTIPPLSTSFSIKNYQEIIQRTTHTNIGIIAGILEGFDINSLKNMADLGIFGIKIYPGSTSSKFELNWNPLIELEKIFRGEFNENFIDLLKLIEKFDEIYKIPENNQRFIKEVRNWVNLFEESAKFNLILLFHPDIPIPSEQRKEFFEHQVESGESPLKIHSETFSILHELLHIIFIFKILSFMKESKKENMREIKNSIPKIQFCHVSNPKSVELIKILKSKYNINDIRIEVTPHHLFLNYTNFNEIQAISKVLPPLRSEDDNIQLQKLLENGEISFIGTDHAPHSMDEKKKPFFDAPSGFPELDTYALYFLSKIFNGYMNLQNFVKYASYNPASYFGLVKKGKLEASYDADIIVVEKTAPYHLLKDDFKSKANFSPYPIDKICAKILHTIILGKLMINNDNLHNIYPDLKIRSKFKTGRLLHFLEKKRNSPIEVNEKD